MADISITASSVVPGAGASINRVGTAGATITAGQTVYQDANGLWQLAKANGTAAQKALGGIALSSASLNQPLSVLQGGLITIGGTVVIGTVYFLSGNNPGGVAPVGDVTTGWYVIVLGVATTTGIINCQFFNTTVQL